MAPSHKKIVTVGLANASRSESSDALDLVSSLSNVKVRDVEIDGDFEMVDLVALYADDTSNDIEKHISDFSHDIPILGITDNEEVLSLFLNTDIRDQYLLTGNDTIDSGVLEKRVINLKRAYTRNTASKMSCSDLSVLVEFSPDAFLVVNEDMSVKYMNANSTPFKSDFDTIETRQDIVEMTHPDDLDSVLETFQYILDNPDEVISLEYRVKSQDGSWVWVENIAQNLIGHDSLDGVLSIVREIDNRKRSQEKLKRERDRLDNVISVMSHDLRNLLNVGMARSEMLAEEHDDDNARAVKRSLRRMEDLISDSLALAENGEAVEEFESIYMPTIVSDTATNIVDSEDTVTYVGDDFSIKADKSRLSNLLENLFKNSIEHNDDNVEIRVGMLDDESGFFVEDTGIGIDEDERDKVFESGYSTGTGSGLGLNIVGEITKAHGWDVEICDSYEEGARFEFTGVTVLKS